MTIARRRLRCASTKGQEIPDYDAIVVGSGVGGGVAAARLADAQLRVLVVERGFPLRDPSDGRDERKMLIDRIGSDDRRHEIDGRAARPLVGGVPGGGSALYGGALLRPSREDFVPGRHYGERIPRAIWEWPFGYDELAPYYGQAEDLLGVCGDAEADMPHLARRGRPYRSASPPLDPFSEELARGLESAGATPFRLPLAIDFDRCQRCPRCPGYVCPTGARTSTESHLLAPRERRGRLDRWHGMEVEQIVSSRTGPIGIRLRDRRLGRAHLVTAEHCLLAAGAIGTPLLLEHSALGAESGELGRNHMCHLGALAVALFAQPIGADTTFLKRIGLSDDYLGTPGYGEKLGSAQVIPIPGVESLKQQIGFPIPDRVARGIHRRSILMAGYVEDLPSPANRIRSDGRGGVRVERRFSSYDIARGRVLARRLARSMRRAGAAIAFAHVASNDREHLAHQVGTCRAARDPRHSVVDPQCRLHGHENLWIVDGSVLPTSLGVGPALTIAANALRVADIVIGGRGA